MGWVEHLFDSDLEEVQYQVKHQRKGGERACLESGSQGGAMRGCGPVLPAQPRAEALKPAPWGCQISSPLHLFLVFWSKGVFWNIVKEEVSWESSWVTMKGQTRFPKDDPHVFLFVLFLRQSFLCPTLTSNSLYSHIWPWTPHLFVSISQILGLQAWASCQLKTEATSLSLEPMNS